MGYLFGPKIVDLHGLNGAGTDMVKNMACGDADTIYTHSHPLAYNVAIGCAMLVTSVAGTVDVDVYLEQSWYQLTPAEEGLAHAAYKTPTGSVKLIDITTEVWQYFQLGLLVFPYMRLRIVGAGAAANNADATCLVKLATQEQN